MIIHRYSLDVDVDAPSVQLLNASLDKDIPSADTETPTLSAELQDINIGVEKPELPSFSASSLKFGSGLDADISTPSLNLPKDSLEIDVDVEEEIPSEPTGELEASILSLTSPKFSISSPDLEKNKMTSPRY